MADLIKECGISYQKHVGSINDILLVDLSKEPVITHITDTKTKIELISANKLFVLSKNLNEIKKEFNNIMRNREIEVPITFFTKDVNNDNYMGQIMGWFIEKPKPQPKENIVINDNWVRIDYNVYEVFTTPCGIKFISKKDGEYVITTNLLGTKKLVKY
jgi:hypothetical protein